MKDAKKIFWKYAEPVGMALVGAAIVVGGALTQHWAGEQAEALMQQCGQTYAVAQNTKELEHMLIYARSDLAAGPQMDDVPENPIPVREALSAVKNAQQVYVSELETAIEQQKGAIESSGNAGCIRNIDYYQNNAKLGGAIIMLFGAGMAGYVIKETADTRQRRGNE